MTALWCEPILDCTPQARKPCTRPASKPKKEPGDGDRDNGGLLNRGFYMSEAKGSWSDTPPCTADGRQDLAAVFTPRGRGRLPVVEGIDIGWPISWLPGKPAEGYTPQHPFDQLS